MQNEHGWKVVKFGGTSVSSLESWKTIARRVEELLAEGSRPLVVCSALSGISDGLERIIARAPHGEHQPELDEIVRRHREFASELGLDFDSVIGEESAGLARLAHGAALVQEASPGLQAKIMATGEMMSTRLGAAFIVSLGIDIGWCDARELLIAAPQSEVGENKRFLSATCEFDDDPNLRERLAERQEAALLTQGFIAMDEHGRTVLLGRGGSDTSAAYLAAKLGASLLEIWTDVPGMFTANPRQVPQARLLKRLDYDEAQELASMGAKVLHPRCIPPARWRGIPIHVRCTTGPEMPGTLISSQSPEESARVKAVSAKQDVALVSMDTLGMWQQVGFLSDVFAVFKSLGLSIDLVATSESNVTVTLDPRANLLGAEIKEELMRRLDEVCTARLREGCAVVSLVGRDIRSILSRLTSAMRVFEEHDVYLVSQAASDLNLSLVVDEGQANRLVKNLHSLLLGEEEEDAVLGPRWSALAATDKRSAPSSPAWWRGAAERLREIAEREGSVFVYDETTIRREARALTGMKAVSKVFYAMKANCNKDVLGILESEGLGFECVSPSELELARSILGEAGDRLLFTPNFASRPEYEAAFDMGAMVTLDNLHPVEHWPKVFEQREVIVRVDPGTGRGHHEHVRTAGPSSKFGVDPSELPRLAALADEIGMRVFGLHAHVGSGIQHSGSWAEVAVFLESMRSFFPGIRILNLGGGLGVPERPGQPRLGTREMDETLLRFKAAHPELDLWLEPGRFLVSEAGVLLSSITQLKAKGAIRYIGIETGMNSLLRPALYGSHHGVVNLTRLNEEAGDFFHVVGPICESGDVLCRSRQLPEPQEGDVMLIMNCGAYGRVMSSQYNLRSPAKEILLAE